MIVYTEQNDKKNRRLAKVLRLFGYSVTICNVEKGDRPYLKVSAYGPPRDLLF